jgi:AraC-like DNA-binding protein
MLLNFEQRPSDSPLVDSIWRTRSTRAGNFTSVAFNHWQIVVWTAEGKSNVTVRGPETKATLAYCPPETEFFAIVFKPGTLMPDLPASSLIDKDANLPQARCNSFCLNGAAWQIPTYENADAFVDKLVKTGLLTPEPIVNAALQGHLNDISLRSVQRRFLRVTGLTHTALRQIERARFATSLLRDGLSILDTVEQAGYFDQPHLTRSMKHYVGHTPAQLMDKITPVQLSFLYNTGQ